VINPGNHLVMDMKKRCNREEFPKDAKLENRIGG